MGRFGEVLIHSFLPVIALLCDCAKSGSRGEYEREKRGTGESTELERHQRIEVKGSKKSLTQN